MYTSNVSSFSRLKLKIYIDIKDSERFYDENAECQSFHEHAGGLGQQEINEKQQK